MDKSIKRRKGVEIQTISVGVEAREDTCGKNPIEKGVVCTGKKFYRPALPSTYKETGISEDLNSGMEWVFRDYGRSLKQKNNPLPTREYMIKCDVQTNTKEREKNPNYRFFPVAYRTRSKRWSKNTGSFFGRMYSVVQYRYFHSRLTQVAIHLSAVNHLGTVLMIRRLCKICWKLWMKIVWWKRTTDHGGYFWL